MSGGFVIVGEWVEHYIYMMCVLRDIIVYHDYFKL